MNFLMNVCPTAGKTAGEPSGEDVLNHFPVNIRQPESPPLEFVTESFMVYTHQMHESRLKIMDVNGVLYNVITKIVRLTIAESRLHPRSSHPHRETAWMVIPTIVSRC